MEIRSDPLADFISMHAGDGANVRRNRNNSYLGHGQSKGRKTWPTRTLFQRLLTSVGTAPSMAGDLGKLLSTATFANIHTDIMPDK